MIRGATPHFDYVCAEVTKGVAQVGLKSGKPVIFSELSPRKPLNKLLKGLALKLVIRADAAVSAIEMVNLIKDYNRI